MFDNMIADIESNKKLSLIVTELFLRGRKLNISLVFISKSYFKLPKTIRRMRHIILSRKFLTEENLKQIVSNHSSDIYFKYSMKLYKDYTKEPYSFLC